MQPAVVLGCSSCVAAVASPCAAVVASPCVAVVLSLCAGDAAWCAGAESSAIATLPNTPRASAAAKRMKTLRIDPDLREKPMNTAATPERPEEVRGGASASQRDPNLA